MIESIVEQPRPIAPVAPWRADQRSGALQLPHPPLGAEPPEPRRQELGGEDAQHHLRPLWPRRGGGAGARRDLRPAGRAVALAGAAAQRTLGSGWWREGGRGQSRSEVGRRRRARCRLREPGFPPRNDGTGAWGSWREGRWRRVHRQSRRGRLAAAAGCLACTCRRQGSRERCPSGGTHPGTRVGLESRVGTVRGTRTGPGRVEGAGEDSGSEDRLPRSFSVCRCRQPCQRARDRTLCEARRRQGGADATRGSAPCACPASGGESAGRRRIVFGSRQRQGQRQRLRPRQVGKGGGAGASSRLGSWPRRCCRST